MKNLFTICSILLALSSCAILENIRKPEEIDHLSDGPKIDIRRFLNGNLEGFAIIKNKDNKIIATQSIKVSGKWEDNKGIVQFDYIYADGFKDSRTWLISVDDNGSNFSAVGHDVVTPAVGRQIGNVAQMVYSLLLQSKDGRVKREFEDKFYLIDDRSAIVISKYKSGFSESGQLIVSLKKTN